MAALKSSAVSQAKASNPALLRAFLQTEAAELAFDAIGICRPDAIPQVAERLASFLKSGHHGDMDWMNRTAKRRADPAELWPDAKSVVMVGLSYAPDRDPLEASRLASHGAISVYARGRDYHDVLKSRLKQLARRFAERTQADVKVFVDTAPLMEKPLAAAAGLGWQGKHSNLVSREHGSWLFLGAMLTTADIAPDEPHDDSCGSCRRCLDACPTDAFPTPYVLDARRCIAYLTIEHKGHIASEFRAAIGNRVFGCDDCLAACPWNKFAREARELRFKVAPGAAAPPLAELLALDDIAFRKRFAGTPAKRTGRNRVLRNALIAAGNSGDQALAPAAELLTEDPSPIVRAMAVWAFQRLADTASIARLRRAALPRETDPAVRSEWEAGQEGL